MNQIVPFKTRVKNDAIKYASIYEKVMNNKEYLIYSKSFCVKKYYILKAYKTNYLHLIGVHTTLSPLVFYEKCLNGTLTENDFDFSFKNKKDSETKGSVRRKIKSLVYLEHFFENVIKVEEKFSKGNISCALADTDGNITLGYAKAENCVPMTLLNGNELSNKAVSCDLLLSRNKGDNEFNDILIGNQKDLDLFLKNNSEIRCKTIKIENLNAQQLYELAMKYIYGDGVEEDNDLATHLLMQAHDMGHIEATYNLGICYHYGHGADVDLKKAFELYLESAHAGYAKGYELVGRFYNRGIYVKQDKDKAKYYLTKAIESSDTEAIEEAKKELQFNESGRD